MFWRKLKMSNKTAKCSHCKKCFFVIDNNYICPHCKKVANELDHLKDLFGLNTENGENK